MRKKAFIMEKKTLIDMLNLAHANGGSSKLITLINKIKKDKNLKKYVCINNFSYEDYEIREITWIRICFYFTVK